MNIKNKEFFLSSWAINNKTIIYVIMVLFLISGITAYKTMPRELFPEINSTNIFVTTIFRVRFIHQRSNSNPDSATKSYPSNPNRKLLPLFRRLKAIENIVEKYEDSSINIELCQLRNRTYFPTFIFQ